jgi:Flp pilus assembly protein TadG
MKSPVKRSSGERGTALLVTIVAMVWLIIPVAGLAVDTGFLYATKARLQASVDAAALGAARALSVGSSTTAQAANAKQNAVNWFYANFPAGEFSTTGTQMDTTDTHAHVYDDPTNPHLQHVDIMASTNGNTMFMRWLGFSTVPMTAYGYATRRDVAIMMVVDRSGSMCLPSAAPCSATSSTPCGSMVTAAKVFTGQFAEGRDSIGMVSFADNAYLHSAPVTTFQTTLGYTNSSGSGTGEIDTLACAGGTNTAQAISLGYNELYKLNEQGALNVIMFETDGLPNTVTVNFWDGTNAGILNGSHCADRSGVLKGAGGFGSAAAIPYWQGNSTTPTHAMGTGSYVADIPAGMVGAVGGFDPPNNTNYDFLFKAYTTVKTNNYNETANQLVTGAPSSGGSCLASSYPSNDLAWLPQNDVYGNDMTTSYQSVTTSGGYISPITMAQIRASAFNAADSAATTARTHNSNLPVYFFGLGLGGNGANPPNYVLMQRMANDPNGDTFNTGPSAPYYSACSLEANCTTSTTQPVGTFIYAPNTNNLGNAFLKLSSQILRLSK